MNTAKAKAPPLDDLKVHVRLKLCALWASVMFCYVYGDFVGLFQPGKLQAMGDDFHSERCRRAFCWESPG